MASSLILGLFHPWIVAIVVSVACSALSVGGFVLQKIAVQDEDSRRRWPQFGDMVCSPIWLLGFVFAVIAPLPGNLVAYALAPLSLTAPLSGVTVVLNTIAAPVALGEKLQLWPDLPSTGLIITGTILSTCTGERDDGPDIDLERLRELFQDQIFLTMLVLLVCSLLGCFLDMYRRREEISKASRSRPTNPPMLDVVMPAWSAAAAGALSNICLKLVGELMKYQEPFLAVFCVAGLVPCAVLQLNMVNRGLRLYFQTIFFPVYSAFLVLTNTVYGAVFFQEYASFFGNPSRFAVFALGVACVVVGVSLFCLRVPEIEMSVDPPPPTKGMEDAPALCTALLGRGEELGKAACQAAAPQRHISPLGGQIVTTPRRPCPC